MFELKFTVSLNLIYYKVCLLNFNIQFILLFLENLPRFLTLNFELY